VVASFRDELLDRLVEPLVVGVRAAIRVDPARWYAGPTPRASTGCAPRASPARSRAAQEVRGEWLRGIHRRWRNGPASRPSRNGAIASAQRRQQQPPTAPQPRTAILRRTWPVMSTRSSRPPLSSRPIPPHEAGRECRRLRPGKAAPAAAARRLRSVILDP